MINFVKGEGVAKGIRNVELRQYYVREEYHKGRLKILYMKGTNIPADQLTKIGSKEQFTNLRKDTLVLELWDEYSNFQKSNQTEDIVEVEGEPYDIMESINC